MAETVDTTTISTQGHFGNVEDRIVAIATQGHFEELEGDLEITAILSNL